MQTERAQLTDFASFSWLWQKRKKAAGEEDTRLADYLQQNGNRGMEITVGGRRCPAHEDAKGFAEALVTFLCK